MVGPSERAPDALVDILIVGLPEHPTVDEAGMQLGRGGLEVDFDIALENVENEDDIDDSEGTNRDRTQQIQDDRAGSDAVALQDLRFIIGNPEHQHHKRLQEEREKHDDVIQQHLENVTALLGFPLFLGGGLRL